MASCGTDEVLKKANDALEETPAGRNRAVPRAVSMRWAAAVIMAFPEVYLHVDTNVDGWENKVIKPRTPPMRRGGREMMRKITLGV